MADYFTQFSCIFDVGSADNATRAQALHCQLADEIEATTGCDLGFDMEVDPTRGPGALWISSDGHGEPEHVIEFVLACAEAFDFQGRWGFAWALTCSKPRIDGFGGGAHALDLGTRKTLAWTDCAHWLAAMLDPATDPDKGIAFA